MENATEKAARLQRGDSLYWYCIMTVYHDDGKIERSIVRDDRTGAPFIVKSYEKPLDECYSRKAAAVYYTYCHGYKEALACLAR
ncbi:MAG: hypothetical protein J6N51_10865 [Selenomonas sp.]|nr:hypothetical protein [Selenomonas sp.]MBP3730985.1 hypothetical protein [Mailhella sp.]